MAIEDSVLVVDGVPQAEPGIDHSRIDGTYFGPVTVPAATSLSSVTTGRAPSTRGAMAACRWRTLQATVLWPAGR